jgi:hypothetical protein
MPLSDILDGKRDDFSQCGRGIIDVGGSSTSRVEMLLVILIYSMWNREGYISSRATYWTNESKARKIQHF